MKRGFMSATTTSTKSESKTRKESSKPASGEATPSLASGPLSPSSREANVVSRNYLKDAAEHLLTWMNRMDGTDVTAANVNAVCNIAQQVANIVKVNIDLKKSGL
jgi:hypothetical protein